MAISGNSCPFVLLSNITGIWQLERTNDNSNDRGKRTRNSYICLTLILLPLVIIIHQLEMLKSEKSKYIYQIHKK